MLPISPAAQRLLRAYKPDLLIEKAVVVELKTIDKILPVHEAQILTYLRLSDLERGVLINFNSVPLKAGIRRLNRSNPSPVSPVSSNLSPGFSE
ncbi:MAG: GxxExxY protein [Gemmatimonadales bacterium]